MQDLPTELDGQKLLSLQLPSIPIMEFGMKVGAREFYLCYSPQHTFLFIVETEMTEQRHESYRAQYGANDNYDKYTTVHRTVWLYALDAARAQDPVIADHLKPYLPSKTL